ncbi:MAG: uncharacterized protein JWO36_5336 [Myxococcales bacterium]|nr:uncharacterized protein [Myxococcales bacterium]
MNKRAYVLGAAMVLLASIVAVALRSFAEAAFLGAYGAKQMPWLLIANAAGFAVAALGYDAITRRARAKVVDLALLGVLGVAAAAAPSMLAAGVPAVVLVVGLAAASQVAGLALWNRVAATVAGRDARRMLPRAGAAVTAGGAIAGLGAGVLIPRLGLAAIPYLGAAVTLAVLAVFLAQDRALAAGGAPGGVVGATPEAATAPISALQRRLIFGLVTVAILEAIVSTVVDLQFLARLKGHYADTQDRAIALSLFYGGTNAILFVLQTAAVPLLLVTRSLTFTAAIHPLMLILSYLGFAASPGFIGIAGTRTADQVLRLATSRTSQEVSLSALPPGPRARWKVLLRGAVWPAGAAAAALVLLALGPEALRDPVRLAMAAIAIAVAWAIAARVAARRFQAALAAPLGIRAVETEDPRRIDLDTLERWTRAAGSDDPKTAALARAAVARARIDPGDLSNHLRHDEPEVRAAMYDQLSRDLPREPKALVGGELREELRAAIAIEDDDRALALGIKALALRLDKSGIERGKQRAGLSREVDEAVRMAELMATGGPVVAAEIGPLCERHPRWLTELIRRGWLTDPTHDGASRDLALREAAANPAQRAGALSVIANLPTSTPLEILVTALEAGEPAASLAIETIDEVGADLLAGCAVSVSPLARAELARASGRALSGSPIVAALIADPDPEVAYAALRTALAIARGGVAIPIPSQMAAHRAALDALAAHLDARDALAGNDAWSACARYELETATRRCVARMLWAAAVAAATAGRDPAPLAASARYLIGAREADRKRALDVVQETNTGSSHILELIERWMRPAGSLPTAALGAIATFDPWLARLGAGELVAIEPTLVDLRRPPLFASIAGPALCALAERAARKRIDGELFEAGDTGDAMYVVTAGALVASRAHDADRRLEVGNVVGEVAVLSRAPRAATVCAAGDGAEVLEIDRATFTAAARRAPELVLGLSASLAGWLAPNRPDVL